MVLSSFGRILQRLQGSFIHQDPLNYYMNYYMTSVGRHVFTAAVPHPCVGPIPLPNDEPVFGEADFYDPIPWAGNLNRKHFPHRQKRLSPFRFERDRALLVGQSSQLKLDRVVWLRHYPLVSTSKICCVRLVGWTAPS